MGGAHPDADGADPGGHAVHDGALRDEPLAAGPARGLSNVRRGPLATVRVRSGRLLVVESPASPPAPGPAVRLDAGDPEAKDPIDRESSRPDFIVPVYAVINRDLVNFDMGDYATTNTLVTAETPPTFLVQTTEDTTVIATHSLQFYQACLEKGVPAEMHIFQFGPHGLGLAPADPVKHGHRDHERGQRHGDDGEHARGAEGHAPRRDGPVALDRVHPVGLDVDARDGCCGRHRSADPALLPGPPAGHGRR